MFPRRPGRIPGFDYLGLHRYFLTICARLKSRPFLGEQTVTSTLLTFQQYATEFDFEILAYCFMPDHVHFVVEGTTQSADFQQFVARSKQVSGFQHKRQTGRQLWQNSYHDHVLRDEEETWRVVKYVIENPIRAGLASELGEYGFCGSSKFAIEQLKDLWMARQG